MTVTQHGVKGVVSMASVSALLTGVVKRAIRSSAKTAAMITAFASRGHVCATTSQETHGRVSGAMYPRASMVAVDMGSVWTTSLVLVTQAGVVTAARRRLRVISRAFMASAKMAHAGVSWATRAATALRWYVQIIVMVMVHAREHFVSVRTRGSWMIAVCVYVQATQRNATAVANATMVPASACRSIMARLARRLVRQRSQASLAQATANVRL